MKIFKLTALMGALLLTGFIHYNADSPLYRLKAVYLEKFSLFVNWPDESNITDTDKDFVITVIGKNPFNGELKNLYEKEKAKILKKNVKLSFINRVEEIEATHILFVTESASNLFEQIYNKVKEKPILLIADKQGYAQKGAHISFYVTDQGKLHFEINRERAVNSKIGISSRLLKIAKIVE